MGWEVNNIRWSILVLDTGWETILWVKKSKIWVEKSIIWVKKSIIWVWRSVIRVGKSIICVENSINMDWERTDRENYRK